MRRYSRLTVIFLLVCWNTFAEAQLTKLTVGYSAISEVDMPAWVAKETKLFEKNGLDVQLIYFTGGTTAVLALVSGEVPISQVAGPAVVNAALAGSDVVMIAGGATSADYWLMSGREIKKPTSSRAAPPRLVILAQLQISLRATRWRKSV
jgi:ABC-type nitrate/sulfonate/bicarbonate transport system substrate-binding protein